MQYNAVNCSTREWLRLPDEPEAAVHHFTELEVFFGDALVFLEIADDAFEESDPETGAFHDNP